MEDELRSEQDPPPDEGWFDPDAPPPELSDPAPTTPPRLSRAAQQARDALEAHFAADKHFDGHNPIRDAWHDQNRAAAATVVAILTLWDEVVLDEQRAGRPVEDGGPAERGFGVHIAYSINTNPRTALRLLHTYRDLRELLPEVWARFVAGDFGDRAAQAITEGATGLSESAIALYDGILADAAPDLTAAELDRKIERTRAELDPAAAEAREQAATDRRYVQATPLSDGQAKLTVVGPQIDIAAMWTVLHKAAVHAKGREGETRARGALQFDLLCDLVLLGGANRPVCFDNPGTPKERTGDPRVPQRKAIEFSLSVVIPIATATADGDQPGTLAGYGSVLAPEAQRIVRNTRFWSRVIVDPVDDRITAWDSSEKYVPAGLKRVLEARDETCRQSGCGTPGHVCDLDHTIRREDGGRTAAANLAHLCRRDHQIKDEGYLDVVLLPDGSLRWRTKWGAVKITRPAMRLTPEPEAADAAESTTANSTTTDSTTGDDPAPF